MFLYSPNMWLVLATAVVAVIIGVVWYSKISPAEIGGIPANRRLAILGVAALLESYVLAHLVYYTGAYTWLEGAKTGLWIWFGFIVSNLSISAAVAGRSPKTWYVDAGYQLILLLVMGALLATW